ncbi:MAG: hypothetical protein VKL59_08815 [Nostocaceae cyanobacterium]|nr:hypothetical protein [Nostocaceae cyanobacterium]
MILTDLEYCQPLTEQTITTVDGGELRKNLKYQLDNVSGGSDNGAGVLLGVFAEAIGKYTSTRTNTIAQAIQLPNGGTLAFGIAIGIAFAYTPPSP